MFAVVKLRAPNEVGLSPWRRSAGSRQVARAHLQAVKERECLGFVPNAAARAQSQAHRLAVAARVAALTQRHLISGRVSYPLGSRVASCDQLEAQWIDRSTKREREREREEMRTSGRETRKRFSGTRKMLSWLWEEILAQVLAKFCPDSRSKQTVGHISA